MALQVNAPKHRRARRFGLPAAIAATALVGGSFALATANASPVGQPGAVSASPQRVGSAPQAPVGAVQVGAPSDDTALRLSVNLQPRDPAEVRALAKAVTTKHNPLYHHYLSKGQFGKVYGATPQTIAAVEASLRAEGLTPGAVSADRLSIPVRTTVGQAAKAFHTGFASYRLKDGTTGFLNTSAPQISGAVAAQLTGIAGLDATFRPVANHIVGASKNAAVVSKSTKSTRVARAVTPSDSGPQFCSTGIAGVEQTIQNETGRSSSDGNGWYSAQNLASVYGMDHTSTTGAGVTVGVLEWERYSASDLAAYQACYGTHVPVSVVPVDGGPTVAPNPNINVGIESLLDLEILAGMAPGSHVIDYEGPDLTLSNGKPNTKFTDADWLDPMRRMVTDDSAQVVSISYGGCELDSDSTVVNTENWTFIEAALQGQTVLNSSGDSGRTSCIGDSGAPYQNSPVVSDPADQPYVTAVGGTSLSGSGASAGRTSWSHDGSGSGGGTSKIWSLDDVDGYNYQHGFTGPGFSAANCKPSAGYVCRQVPDVSALADPDTGYPVYIAGQWGPVGGTSGASPTWAALVAQADAQASCQTSGPAGFINPTLYANSGSAFTDVTTSGADATALPAATGYDLATGLGEPKGATVAGDLCAALPVPAQGASTYHPVAPKRLLDTRKSGSTAPQVAAGGIASALIEGNTSAGIPTSGVTAVVLNVTVVNTQGGGVLTAWGDGTTRPKTSNLNWVKGNIISNLVTVPLSGDGWVDFYASSATNVIADVQGYYTNDTSGASYTAHTPQRLLDTRAKIGVPGTTPITNGAVSVPIRNVAGIPATATAVVLNVTATGTVGGGFITAYPGGTTKPNASNINWSASNTTLPGLVIVPIGSNGAVNLAVAGKSHVIADVFGYFDPNGASKYTKTGPKRLLDTRAALGVTTKTAIPAGHTVVLQVTGGNVPTGIKAVVLNVTVTGTTGSGVLTAFADGTTQPKTSNLNWVAGETVPNLVLVPVGADGKVKLYVSSTTHIVADVFGYFA
ncbi:S53 family peptidase [Streptacidiphilus rugosus]|uniref:S53 family peptidase n=1 Tax=Streptacidiphilus rugosus TaxID=405783 RepID=UPI00056156F2|nr:S53 family peptidase [Streptacidiphilus rugosus]